MLSSSSQQTLGDKIMIEMGSLEYIFFKLQILFQEINLSISVNSLIMVNNKFAFNFGFKMLDDEFL